MRGRRKKKHSGQDDLAFEDALQDDWSRDLDVVEVPIGNRPLWYLGIAVLAVTAVIAGRVIYLNMDGAYYTARAENNLTAYSETPAPRGVIYDSEGTILAESKASFEAVLDANTFLKNTDLQSSTIAAAQSILGITPDDFATLMSQASAEDFATPIVLDDDLTQTELVNLQALNNPAIKVESDFVRDYPDGSLFASVVGYTGRVSESDLSTDPTLTGADTVGKTGIEGYYDKELRGTPGVTVQYKNAAGQVLRTEQQSTPTVGQSIQLTIDGGLQQELSQAISNELAVLGRTVGVGLAMDPQTGAILSMVNIPTFNNNAFTQPSASSTAEIEQLLTSPDKPLLNRIVNGYYNPGSTIKPLDAVAALQEGVIDPNREIFSPGYLMIPDPYNSSTPTRYADWQYQGNVNLAAALAQSSDVYFYIVGGGSPPVSTPLLNNPLDYGISGLGITKLNQWWQTFGLGKQTGIDMPNESTGFLPTPAWKQSTTGTPWLLGDTYNVAIGQGNLLLSPLQLLDYISAIANGGEIYRPYLNASSTPSVDENLTYLLPEIQDVQEGMKEGVTSPRGTSYTLDNLPISVCAKTGSAQVYDNTQENAIFVGYAPCNNPQIALLILIENSKQGSLNAVPIAKVVLNWYYENRMLTNNNATTTGTPTAQ
ncbi:MAG TPA: penicillin-binding protein 2 [Candidatus Paceibacterota bacterium]|jgi:penicillin-binding protein 2|nr:penicillin-binding protein 2 [Candidatus Paceibacterota bacterium]